MGLQSALTTALTGLQAAETTIDVVGNNVANSQTVGFKESNVKFATQFLQTTSIGSAPTGNLGGTNPRQIGLGAKVAEIAPDFTQGTVEISANPLDLAIQGDGFLVVQSSQGQQYTRNGQLTVNSNNEIVTTTGQRLLGYGVDDSYNVVRSTPTTLSIPIGAASVAQETQNVFLSGNLSPDQELRALQPGIIESAILSDGSVEVPANLGSSDITALSPPNVSGSATTANTGAGSIAAGTYVYRIVYVDASGAEAAPSNPFGSITTTGAAGVDQAVSLNGLPVPGASESYITQKRIYRTDATGAGPFRLITTVPASATTYTDTAAAGTTTLVDTAVDTANYSYYVTFYNGSTGQESRPTSVIGPLPVSDIGRRVRLQNIPLPASADFDSVRIYRNTDSDDDTFKLVATLPDTGGSTTSYIDRTPDSALSSVTDTLDVNGPPINTGLELINLVTYDGNGVYRNLFPAGDPLNRGGVISFSGRKGDTELTEKQFTYDASTTVQQLLDFMDQSLGIVNATTDAANPIPGSPGASVTADSRLRFTSNLGVENELSIGLTDLNVTPNGSTAAESVLLPFSSTQSAQVSATNEDGSGATAEFVVYDSLGLPIRVSVTTYLESTDGNSTTYRWIANSPDNEVDSTGLNVDTVVGTGVIRFDGNGDIQSISNSTIAVQRARSASTTLEFDLDLTRVSGLDAVSSASEPSSLAAIQQDGFPPGVLNSFIISESGSIRGIFSNGTERTLGQILLARFTNNSGLQQLGDNLWGVGVNSGLPILTDPGSQGVGTLTAGAVELSNTDIGQNLIELILASTQYRGGARVISAAQELLDELLALRR